jgi:hypothetical protein
MQGSSEEDDIWQKTASLPDIIGSRPMGHALSSILQDIVIQWKHIDGYNGS